jgi:hypothetical protein
MGNSQAKDESEVPSLEDDETAHSLLSQDDFNHFKKQTWKDDKNNNKLAKRIGTLCAMVGGVALVSLLSGRRFFTKATPSDTAPGTSIYTLNV